MTAEFGNTIAIAVPGNAPLGDKMIGLVPSRFIGVTRQILRQDRRQMAGGVGDVIQLPGKSAGPLPAILLPGNDMFAVRIRKKRQQ